MSLASWWAGRHERRRKARVLNDLARWYMEQGHDDFYGAARRDLRLQELGVPEQASELEVRCVWCGTTGYGKECPPCEVEHEGEPFPTEAGGDAK